MKTICAGIRNPDRSITTCGVIIKDHDSEVKMLLEALLAIQQGFREGSIKWAKPRKADSDPYHKANYLMCKAINNSKILSHGVCPACLLKFKEVNNL